MVANILESLRRLLQVVPVLQARSRNHNRRASGQMRMRLGSTGTM
jgi:hypothetical protein